MTISLFVKKNVLVSGPRKKQKPFYVEHDLLSKKLMLMYFDSDSDPEASELEYIRSS